MFRRWGAAVVLALCLLVFTGCGNSKDGGGKEKTGKMTPESLGKAIAAIYIESITQSSQLMKAREEVDMVKPKLEKLKEDIITRLVKLGRIRESLDEAGKQKTDRHISRGIGVVSRDAYDEYNGGYRYYAGLDRETGNLIASFNIITQYAIFELLKKQAPEEAQRLGIE